MDQSEANGNIKLLREKFKSIADITVSYDRYDLVVYNYNELEDISKFIEEKTSIKSWTLLKTRVNPNSNMDWL